MTNHFHGSGLRLGGGTGGVMGFSFRFYAIIDRHDTTTTAHWEPYRDGKTGRDESRPYFITLAGYVLTSRGRVDTRIVQDVRFGSVQQFDLSPTREVQNLQQTTRVWATTTTRTGPRVVVRRRALVYPLAILSARLRRPDKSASQAMTVRQGYQVTERVTRNGVPVFFSTLSDEVTPTDTVLFNASRAFAGHQGWKSRQTYSYSDSRGHRYHRTVTAENGVLTGITR